jgi:hypothetical protein
MTWITDRLPYQVLERNNAGMCVCVCERERERESLMGVGGQARHRMTGSAIKEPVLCVAVLPNAAPAFCVSRPLSSIRGGRTISTCSSVTI